MKVGVILVTPVISDVLSAASSFRSALAAVLVPHASVNGFGFGVRSLDASLCRVWNVRGMCFLSFASANIHITPPTTTTVSYFNERVVFRQTRSQPQSSRPPTLDSWKRTTGKGTWQPTIILLQLLNTDLRMHIYWKTHHFVFELWCVYRAGKKNCYKIWWRFHPTHSLAVYLLSKMCSQLGLR